MALANDQAFRPNQPQGGELQVLDPELPLIAARAALQLDVFLAALRTGTSVAHGRVDAIESLSRMVSSLTGGQAAGGVHALVDPMTADVLSRAYTDAAHSAPLSTWQQLEQAIHDLAGKLAQVGVGSTRDDQVQALVVLRDFCLRLSEYAANKRQIAYGEKPRSQYRS
jgi:hypothetical protein